MDNQNLSEFEETILRYVQSTSSTHERIIKKFTLEDLDESQVTDALNNLHINRHYITIKRLMKPGFFSLGQEITENDQENDYVITLLGKNYLTRSTPNFTSFSNISNSNVSHNSSKITQSIKISEQSQDIQDKIKELELAINKKDSSGIKRAFGYIADKSVDIAIALFTGGLLR